MKNKKTNYPVFDIHAHPSLKLYYFPHIKKFKIRSFSGPFFNPTGLRTNLYNINKSNVKLIVNAHYVIEKNFIKYGFKKPLFMLLKSIAPGIIKKILEKDDYSTLIEQFDLLENKIKNINSSSKDKILKITRSYSEILNLKENEVGIIHAIEGAHSLGIPENGETEEEFLKKIENRIDYLKTRGLMMTGISHFWDNPFLPQTDGTEIIAVKKRKQIKPKRNDFAFQMKRADWKFGDKNKFSKEIVELLLNKKIILDIVHTQEHARTEIYKICKKHNAPIAVSHVGLKHFFDHEYNLSDEEILKIHELKGIIGLIFSKRWLVAPQNRYKNKGGLDDLIENMKYIKKLTGDVSTITIGTDFDGFTTPFKDCYNHSHLNKLIKKMEKTFTTQEIEDILFNNALRVFKYTE